MEPTDRNAAKPRLTRAQWKRRKRLRLARNWAILILVCAAIVALMTKGILWLLPKVNAMLAGPQSFDAASYDGTGYSFDADDERFVLVNTNLPFAEEPSPALADADEASGIQLEAEAAAAYQKMAAAAAEDGVALVLTAGYQDADARSAAYETQKQQYLEKGKTEEEAPALRQISSRLRNAMITAPAMRRISSVRTTRPVIPALIRPAPTSGSPPTPPNTALSCAIRRTGRLLPAWCLSRGTGGMWALKMPLPSVPAA